jgi:hypothetical protein
MRQPPNTQRSQLLAAPRRFRLKRSNGWEGIRPEPGMVAGSEQMHSFEGAKNCVPAAL